LLSLSTNPVLASEGETPARARSIELDLAGWVEEWASACPGVAARESRCEIYFLVRDPIDVDIDLEGAVGAAGERPAPTFSELLELEPLRLVRLARQSDGRAGELEVLLEGIEPETRLAMFDIDQDGLPEPLLVARGRAEWVDVVGAGEAHRNLLVELAGAPPAGLLSSMTPFARVLAWARVGEVVFFRIDGGRVSEISRQRLPVSARVGATTLRLETPVVNRVRPSSDESREEIFAVGPEEQGPSRWRVNLFRPLTPLAQEEAVAETPDAGQSEGGFGEEIWLRTPGPERPVHSQFLERDGQVFLLAQALRSDKVGIVERKKVRLYPLRADRTRAGVAAGFEQMSVSRLWQDLETAFVDHDSNGELDLTLLQREGFSGKKLQIDQYTARGGRLSSRARRSLIKIPWAEWSYGRDLTGDGVKDLLLQSQGLHLIAGRGSDEKSPFEARARWMVPLPDARQPNARVSISIGPEGSSSESSEMSGADTSAEEDALDPEDGEGGPPTGGEDEDEDSGIRWGRPHFVSPPEADVTEILVLGNEKSRSRGGVHVVVLVEPPG
jgi:hypothetical protein